MPSNGNLNGPSKNRLAARRSKGKADRRKRSQMPKDKVAKADTTRGARPGIMPTSGPRAKLSSKKAKKLEKKMGYALKRKMEADGEAEMKGTFRRGAQVGLWGFDANCVRLDAPAEDGEKVDEVVMEIQ